MSELEVGTVHGAWKIKEVLTKGRFLCLCTACGTTVKKVRKHDLVNGKTLMCKTCSHTDKNGSTVDPKMAEVYNTWVSMNQRCLNPTCKDYPKYGGRGIIIHPPWIDSFEAFYMQMGPRPRSDYTIERIDVNGNYEPGNVKWIPRAAQPLNTRSNVRLTIRGKTLLVSQWAEQKDCPIDKFCIYKRLKRNWSAEEAVFTPAGGKRGVYGL